MIKTQHRQAFHKYLTEKEEKQLLKYLKSQADLYTRRDRWLAVFLRQTGVRISVICGKRATKQAAKTQGLTVAEAKQAVATKYLELRPDLVKGGDALRLYVNEKGRQALKELLKVRREMGHAAMADEPLVMSKKKQCIAPRTLQERFKAHALAAGLGDLTPHWFRHTLAKRVMKNSTAEDPRGVVQVALGHKSQGATVIYTMPDKEDVISALEEVS